LGCVGISKAWLVAGSVERQEVKKNNDHLGVSDLNVSLFLIKPSIPSSKAIFFPGGSKKLCDYFMLETDSVGCNFIIILYLSATMFHLDDGIVKAVGFMPPFHRLAWVSQPLP
jgi:hypothetical protein